MTDKEILSFTDPLIALERRYHGLMQTHAQLKNDYDDLYEERCELLRIMSFFREKTKIEKLLKENKSLKEQVKYMGELYDDRRAYTDKLNSKIEVLEKYIQQLEQED